MNIRKTIHILVLVSLLTAGLFTPAAASFNPPFTEVTGGDNPFDGVDVGSYSTPSFADLDGDGDLDAFIGEWLGQIHYYYNYGDAANPAFAAVTGSGNPFYGVDVGGDSAPSFADLDGDGDLDAFIGEFDGNINYYRNDGTAANPSFTYANGAGNPFDGVDVGNRSAASFADLDGDDDLDAFIGEGDGIINYYRNDGTIIAPSFTNVTGGGNPFDGVDVGAGSKPSFADVDGDGDLDAFIGENEGLVHYYRNDGDAASPDFTLVTGSGNPFNGVDAGSHSAPSFSDLDGDGDLDTFIGEQDGIVNTYRNEDTADSPSFTNVGGSEDPFTGVDVGYSSKPGFVDLDGDGDLDAFIGNLAGVIHYYRNDGTAVSPSFTYVTGSGNPFDGVVVGGYSAPSFADLDGDGDMDAFIGNFAGVIYYYRNDGTAVSPSFTNIGGSEDPFTGVDVGNYSAPSFADLDGDGDLDAFIGNYDGVIYYYRNDGTAVSPSFTNIGGSEDPFTGVDVGLSSVLSFADLDGDGDLDAFIGNLAGVIHYYRNDGTAVSPSFTNIGGSEDPFTGVDVGIHSAPSFADLDGDADLDAFIGNYAGVIHYYRNNRAPQGENLTVTVNEDASDDAIDLWPAFQDPDHTPDSSLVYTVIANTNPALFNTVSLTGGQYVNLDYAPDANGTATLTVRGADPGGLWITTTLQVSVTAVNDAPSFTVGVDLIVAEDSGPVSYPAWATNFSPGPENESSQSLLAYHLGSDNPALFADAPAIDPATGDLSFTPATNAGGAAIITVTVQDDGGAANGGTDTSAPQTFTITVTTNEYFIYLPLVVR